MTKKLPLSELKDTILEILEEELDKMMENSGHLCEEGKHCMKCCEENYCEKCADEGPVVAEKKSNSFKKASRPFIHKLDKNAGRSRAEKPLGNFNKETTTTSKVTKEQLQKMIREALKEHLKK